MGWRPVFAREVDLVRLHLAPIRSRSGLAASFGREAFHVDVASDGGNSGPVTAAYAIRWLELGDGIARPAWAGAGSPTPLRGLAAGPSRLGQATNSTAR